MANRSDLIRPGVGPIQCAPWTKAEGIDPIGTTGRYDQFLLVEIPPPWPSDVKDLLPLRLIDAPENAIVLAVVPSSDAEIGTTLITHWRRTSTCALEGADYVVPSAAVSDTASALLRHERVDDGAVRGAAPTEVLLCAHGRRDRCCGNLGTRLHQVVERRFPNVRIRRCSHTGGHRFAPTGFTLPDGRAWAFLDERLVRDIVTRDGDHRRAARHLRGSTAFDAWAQLVDRALFDKFGWSWIGVEVESWETTASHGRDRASVEMFVQLEHRRSRVVGEVAVHRTVPVPSCGSTPTADVKRANEYALTSLMIEELPTIGGT